MIRNQIHKVLSTFQSYGVRALLMGGQACVFYGAAEFSRDTDFAIAIDSDNWARLNGALEALQARVIAVPPCLVNTSTVATPSISDVTIRKPPV